MVVDATGAVLVEHRVATPVGGVALTEVMAEVVTRLRGTVDDVGAVGVGVAGLVDHQGVLRFAPNLPGVVGLDLRTPLTQAAGLPVRVDNDANCALWAECRRGAGRGAGDVLLVTLGTGIGGGLLLGGRLVRGVSGFAGEVGHMVVEPDGPACGCGQRGCWERYASGRALSAWGRAGALTAGGSRLAALAGGPKAVRGEHVTAAAAEGDPTSLAIIDRFAGWVALGLANLVHILDVERCLIGGGLIEAGEVLLAPVQRAFVARVMATEHRRGLRIQAAELGEHAGAVGAALLAAEASG